VGVMPKDIIMYPTPPSTGERRFDMVVGWQRECDVQVGIKTQPEPDGQHHLIDVIYGGHLRDIGEALSARIAKEHALDVYAGYRNANAEGTLHAELGQMVLDAVTGSTPFGDGVYWHPSRSQINDLIRSLRKARDQAFGSDA
jgi:hypothetical protein